tara:strand:- start:116 stop:619 length:504 start_codon:yes stop_codon:yes gene_type:complete
MIGFASFPVFDKTTTLNNDSCDNIIFKNGEEISAKIIEITPDLIKYKKCRNLDGPLISIYKNKVLMLSYNDGSKDTFSLSEKKEDRRVFNERDKVPWGGIASLFFTTIGWVVLNPFSPVIAHVFILILSLLFGSLSFMDKERFWGVALSAMILGTIQLLISMWVFKK